MYFAYRRTSPSGHPRETNNAPALPSITPPVVCGPSIRSHLHGQTCGTSSAMAAGTGFGTPKTISELAVCPEIVAKTVPDSRLAHFVRSTSVYVLCGRVGSCPV